MLVDIGADLEALDYSQVEEITLSGNSYGREACDYLAEVLKRDTPKLTRVVFNDMFVGRKLDELPGSLEVLVRAIMGKNIEYLDLSNNAFGPAGIKSFDFLLREMVSLKVLKVTNCGLGPVTTNIFINLYIGRWRDDCKCSQGKQRTSFSSILSWP